MDTTGTNAVHCDLPTLAEIQDAIVSQFPSAKFLHTEKMVIDIVREDDQLDIVTTEHNRAHRSLRENITQIMEDYYFPGMKKLLKSIIANCKICKENKYQRNPPTPEIGATPLPQYPGEILHVDILITNKHLFLTSIDKFSKFASVIPIASRSILDVKTGLFQALARFRKVRLIVSDNERSLCSNALGTFLRDHFEIEQFFVPTMHSESNGQVERFHSTLLEIARCVKAQQEINDTVDLILLSTHKYNHSVHSTTGRKPIDIVNDVDKDVLKYIGTRIKETQERNLSASNRDLMTRTYQPGEIVFVRRNKRLGNKFDKVFVEGTIERDLGTTVIINGRTIHKKNLR